MKTKRTAARKKLADNGEILCPKCGNGGFNQSLSEIDTIVRLTLTKKVNAIEEIVLHEGKIRFRYVCRKCAAVLLASGSTAVTFCRSGKAPAFSAGRTLRNGRFNRGSSGERNHET